jgi:uncharacterized repeat protein (TIGR01451 family)
MRNLTVSCRVLGFLGIAIMIAGLAVSGETVKQPWRVAFDPDGVSNEPAPAFEATRAVQLLESFDDTTFPPTGWSQVHVVGTSNWSRVTSGSNPTIANHSGAGMALWNGFDILGGKSTRLQSPSISLAAAGAPALHFYMSHDAAYAINDDRVMVQVSTNGGATFSDLGTVSRYDASCTTPCWQEHVFDLTPYTGQPDVVIGLLGVSAYGNNIFIDDVTVKEPAPDFSTSTVNAPTTVVGDYNIPYVIEIVNSGGSAASAATLVDVLPAGTTYVPASITCSAGACSYNDVAGQIEWSGTVPASDMVTVTFSLDPLGVACGSEVVNVAILDDPNLVGGAVSRSATTVKADTSLPALEESFDDETFPPAGWSQISLIGSSSWGRVTAGTNPTTTAHSGAGMARWNSFDISVGDSTRLVTPALDLAGMTVPTLMFWMSHDAGYSDRDDRLIIQVSTDGGMVWDDQGDPISRFDSGCSISCWTKHHVDLSAYAGMPSVTVGFTAVSEYGGNFFVDDIGIVESWFPCSFVSLEPDAIAGGCPGESAVYPLTATNGTPTADTFDLTITNTWPTVADPASFILTPGESGTTDVTVDFPLEAAGGDSDVTGLGLAGQGSGLTDSAQLTSFVYLADAYTDFASLPDSPAGLKTRDHGLVYLDGKLYKLGGDDGAAQANTAVYDIATDAWTTADPMPAPRRRIDCVAIGGKIYCAGGHATAAEGTLFIFDPTALAGAQWTSGASMPSARFAYAGVALDGKYYVIGGYTTTYQNTMVIYDPSTDSWASGAGVPTMAVARIYPQAGAIDGKIYVTGGLSAASTYTASTEIYDPIANSWSPAASLPFPGWVRGADGVINDRFLLIIGGYSADATVSTWAIAYDAMNDLWMAPQQFATHFIYGSEGDTDGDGNFWYVSGRIYENTAYSYSAHTTKVTGCSACTEVSGADFVVDPVSPVALVEATFTGSATGSDTIDYSWDFGGLASGTGQVIGVTFPAPGTYSVTLTASNCGGTGQDIISHDVVVGAVVDLAIETTDGMTEVTAGLSTTYTISVLNSGPSAAVGATVEDLFPAEITSVAWTCSGSGGGVCAAAGSGDISESVDVPSGGQVVFVAHATVGSSATGSIVNTATVSPAASVTDSDLTNNSSTDTDSITVSMFADGFESGTTDAWSPVTP